MKTNPAALLRGIYRGATAARAARMVATSTLAALLLSAFPAGARAGEAQGPWTVSTLASGFNRVADIAIESSGNLVVCDAFNNQLKRVTPAGAVSVFVTGIQNPYGLAIDAVGNIYTSASDGAHIRKITPGGATSVFAGSVGAPGNVDGTGTAAQFSYPAGVAMDAADNLYVIDGNNNNLRKITPAGVVTTLAGSTTGASGNADGTGTAALFNSPIGLGIDAAGNLFVGDRNNHSIRKVTPAGVVTTFAGVSGSAGSADGTGGAARFTSPEGIKVDAYGNLFVADSGNCTIRKITPGGVVSTIAGGVGDYAYVDAVGTAARFSQPRGIALTSTGTIYVGDWSNNRVRKITPAVAGTVPGSNTAPVANAQSVTTNEDIAANITLTGTDADPGTTLTFSIVSGPTNGTLTGSGASRTYTPNANSYGADSFTFKVNDGTEDSAVATVSITVNSVNDAPTDITSAPSGATGGPEVIVWGAPTLFNDNPSQVSTAGTRHAAVRFKSTDHAVNGVSFDRYLGGGAFGNGSLITTTTSGQFPLVNSPSASGTGDYGQLVSHGGFISTNGASIQIGSLTPGNYYQVQLFMPFFDNLFPSNFSSNGGTVTLRCAGPGNPLPDVVTGTFLAGGTTQTINWGLQSGYGGLAAISVRAFGFSINENNAPGAAISALNAIDADAVQTHSFSLVSGTGDTDNGSFTVTGSTLSINVSADFETKSSYSVRVQADDGAGGTFAKAITVSIINLNDNEAPTDIALSNSSIAENNAPGATIGTLSATDANSGDTHTLTFAGGADDGAFTISGNTLTINGSANFEAKSSYAIRIRATDNGGLTYEENFTVSITDVTIPQVINFGTLAGKTFGDADFSVSATGGASGQSVTFSIASGPATISGNTVTITGAGSVTVRASQAGAGDYAAAAPVDQTFTVDKAAQTISFDALAGKTFGDAPFAVSAMASSGDAVTFSIVSGPASIAGNTVTLTGAGNVTVRASQAGNANYEAAADVDQTFTVAKAGQAITFAPPATALLADELTLTATGGASGTAVSFSVVSGPGTLAGSTLTFSENGSVTVRASQAGNGDYEAAADVDATITVGGIAAADATRWQGLLRDGAGDIAGSVGITKGSLGSYTASVRIGTAKPIKAIFNIPAEATSKTVATTLGALTVSVPPSGRVSVSIAGNTASLRPSYNSTVAKQFNIALAPTDATPGGGFTRAIVKRTGDITITGKLPDGRPLSYTAQLADNETFVLYSVVARTSPAALAAGELTIADLATTDVTGELAWSLPPQTTGLHRAGLETTLTASGSLYTTGDSTAMNGAGTLNVTGGNLASSSTAVTITAGKPTLGPVVTLWKATTSTGLFAVKVKNTPGVGGGIYLPKSQTAWGYFHGTTVGGRIELTQP